MSEPIRVMVVDDSVVVRRALTQAIESEPGAKVVATAANGRLALARLETLEVDVILLDIEMPELDGIETLRAIRQKWPTKPVVMCSTMTERGGAVTLDALAAGATDYVTKPSGHASFSEAITQLGRELGRKIRAVVRRSSRQSITGLVPSSLAPVVTRAAVHAVEGPQVLAIGSSTGGPNALLEVWRTLPRAFPVPIVIVQHMPPIFTRLLAERMTALGGIPVREGVDGEPLLPGEARIAPGGRHMEIVGTADAPTVHLNDDEPENSCRPAADPLFRSVARVFGARSLGIVLTGMGQDALIGSRAIVEAGGSIVVQDEATSVVWGMPGYVARAGLAREVVPLSEIGSSILRSFRLTSPAKGRDEHPRERLPLRP